jgi:predicted DNA-binding protein YlxM (UPF0122 family)
LQTYFEEPNNDNSQDDFVEDNFEQLLDEEFDSNDIAKLKSQNGVKSHIEQLKKFLYTYEKDLQFYKVYDSANP